MINIDTFKIGIRISLEKIKRSLVAETEPEIEAKMPEFLQRLESAKEVFELQRLWDDVNNFLKETGHDWNQNLRELQIAIEDRIERKGGIKPKI